ncbi:hypothetical protein LTS08_003800 [Lithohypha guttulata]|uniref:Rhodopsin domain-containing protein n=1 Tax=Lithohypha guttulata TaxID=1690604 RepID=A0AAN7YEQ0_9EURO|nr:hypothetical protein LTR05_006102 [Lithohypha guttulata]KAK5102997.1 hypothetical protein LTS08_003800 [Lithohypha guttulata]
MVYDKSGRSSRTYGNSGPGAVLNTICFIGIPLGFLLIVNRVYWRWTKGVPGKDDIIIILAWVFLGILGAVQYVAVDYGYGRRISELTPDEASDAIRMFYLYQIFYKLTLNLSKLSILTLYLRVFDTRDWFGKITKFLIGLVLIFSFSIM